MSPSTEKQPTRKGRAGQGKRLKPWQFKPGQSGNPGGVRKGTRHLDAALADLMEEKIPGDALGKTWQQAFIQSCMMRALKGFFPFWQMIYERMAGKPVEAPGTQINQVQVINLADKSIRAEFYRLLEQSSLQRDQQSRES